MKKLSLSLDTLAVESFQMAAGEPLRGTVQAHGDSRDCSYWSPMYTFCNLTCRFECGETAGCTP